MILPYSQARLYELHWLLKLSRTQIAREFNRVREDGEPVAALDDVDETMTALGVPVRFRGHKPAPLPAGLVRCKYAACGHAVHPIAEMIAQRRGTPGSLTQHVCKSCMAARSASYYSSDPQRHERLKAKARDRARALRATQKQAKIAVSIGERIKSGDL